MMKIEPEFVASLENAGRIISDPLAIMGSFLAAFAFSKRPSKEEARAKGAACFDVMARRGSQ